jgi:glucosamine-6-phosphate deaminase
VGDNGHLAFCEPGSDRHDPLAARVVELDAATRAQARRSGQFSSEEELPRLGVTTTLPVLLGASSVLALCFGPRRAALLAEALAGPPREALPVSWLTELAGARLYLDTEAAALL